MKIALAQLSATKGDIISNIAHHKRLIHLAIENRANIIIFPELSITGYEPHLASLLACNQTDSIFNDFQKLSEENNIIIGIGVPIQQEKGVSISMLFFQPNQPKQVYSKKYLHADEKPFFISGENENIFIKNTKIAIAICYELSIKAHAETALKQGAKFYLATVAKTAEGVKNAHERLSAIAKTNKIPVLMVNSVGPNDNFVSAGQSAIWNSNGTLLAKLDPTEESLLFYNEPT